MTDNVDNKQKDYHQTKEFQNSISEMHRKMYFSTRYRNKIRRDFTKLQEDSLRNIEKLTSLKSRVDFDIQMAKTGVLWEKLLDLSESYLDWCDKADKLAHERKSTRRKFMLYQNQKENKSVLKINFFAPSENKFHTNYFEIYGRLSDKKNKCRCFPEKYSLNGYKLKDSGTYGRRYKNFTDVTFTLKGKRKTKVHIFPRSTDQFSLWIRKK